MPTLRVRHLIIISNDDTLAQKISKADMLTELRDLMGQGDISDKKLREPNYLAKSRLRIISLPPSRLVRFLTTDHNQLAAHPVRPDPPDKFVAHGLAKPDR